jgi:SAM-dependent methyltransferase
MGVEPATAPVDSGMSAQSSDRAADWLLCVLGRIGKTVPKGTRVLELGCGNGEMVAALRQRGLDAFGCDLQFKPGPRTEELREAGLLRAVETRPYRLPFADGSFDLVVSVSVLEHVMNLDETLREASRVTRAGGEGLHMFPSRYRPIEPHTFVPLGTLVRTHWWLRFWASAGVRNAYQGSLKPAQIADANYKYLHESTNYLSRAGIRRAFEKEFRAVRFCEDLLVACGTGARSNRLGLGKAMQRSRLLTRIYSEARGRAVWVRK